MKVAARVLSIITIVMFGFFLLGIGVTFYIMSITRTAAASGTPDTQTIQAINISMYYLGIVALCCAFPVGMAIATLAVLARQRSPGAYIAIGVLDILFGNLVAGIIILCGNKEEAPKQN